MKVGSEEGVIKRLLAEVCAIDPGAIKGDVDLIEYGLDSARAIDLLVGLESEYGLQIPDDHAARLRTVDDIAAYVRAHAGKGAAT